MELPKRPLDPRQQVRFLVAIAHEEYEATSTPDDQVAYEQWRSFLTGCVKQLIEGIMIERNQPS